MHLPLTVNVYFTGKFVSIYLSVSLCLLVVDDARQRRIHLDRGSVYISNLHFSQESDCGLSRLST